MPMRVEWGDAERSIIIATGEGRWSWNDFHQALEEIVELVTHTAGRVDLIYVQAPGSMMPGGSPMPHYQRAAQLLPKNVGLHVLLKDNVVVRTILSLFLRLYGAQTDTRFAIAGTLDAARNLIHADRAHLHDMSERLLHP